MIERFQGAYRFLSNFWAALVELDGATYRSVEHAYQAAKILPTLRLSRAALGIRSGDPNELVSPRVLYLTCNAGEAKRLSRHLPLRPDWEAVKLAVMEDLIRQKFAREPLRGLLRATDGEHLQEGNAWGDTFWGVSLSSGRGQNHLGQILMKVRAEVAAAPN